MSIATDAATTAGPEKRTVAALTQPMTIYEDDPATSYPEEVAVYHRGTRYLVNPTTGYCDCDDHFYRNTECKHQRRVAFELGERPIPAWANADALDAGLEVADD
jgi:hypothetical protein